MTGTVSKWQRPNSYLTIVALYLFLLATSAIAYIFWVYDWLADSPIATTVFATTIIMAVIPAAGGVMLLKWGRAKTALVVSLAALVLWVLALGGYIFGALEFLGSLVLLYYIAPLPASLPPMFPFVPSLVMIGLLFIGWKKIKEK